MSDDDELKSFEFGSSHPATFTESRRGKRWWVVLILLLAIGGATVAFMWLQKPEMARQVLQGIPFAPSPSVTTAYKWKDENGAWQISDRPPRGGIPYETLEYASDTNVMPLVPPGDN